MDTIEFTAAVQKVQTLVDGGLRVTLDLPEGEIESAALLMACKLDGLYLNLTAVAYNSVKDDETRTINRRAAKKRKQ